MASKKQKRAQVRLLNEVRDQLVLQAERWGRKGYYSTIKLNEMVLDQCRRINGDLQSENANLEYELFMLDSDKRDLLIKMERLQNYIKKAGRAIARYEKEINRQLNKFVTEKDKLDAILRRIRPTSSFSVMISSN